jgi:hypothetical protein
VHSNILRAYQSIAELRATECFSPDNLDTCNDISDDVQKKNCVAAGLLYASEDRCGTSGCNITSCWSKEGDWQEKNSECADAAWLPNKCEVGYKVSATMAVASQYKVNTAAINTCRELFSIQVAYETEQKLMGWINTTMEDNSACHAVDKTKIKTAFPWLTVGAQSKKRTADAILT